MPRWMFFACWCAAAPALAQQMPAAPVRARDTPVHALALHNDSGQIIASVEAVMTDGKHRVLSYAPIQPKAARMLVVPGNECVDLLVVHLNDGETLRAGHWSDCKVKAIVVGQDRIRQ